MGRVVSLFLAYCLFPVVLMAQDANYGKLSPMLRRIVRQNVSASRVMSPELRISTITDRKRPSVCAFVKVAAGGEGCLQKNGCRILCQMGDICIADIPVDAVGRLSLDSSIVRIEANRSTHIQTDSLAWYLNTLPVYEGQNLPQAYTGQGIVMGVMDIGFDLTHPNFYSRDTTEYRIQRFWDMLSNDTVGSQLYVGRDYAGRDELLTVAHARDGLDQSHGTHTLGIAAGSGYDSPYVGMAPQSDICIVANAVSSDIALIDSADYDKYTFATDALGFKYIFDYAQSVGKPCVINFSEGSQQDFWGYDVLYYEMLSRMTGPGRIIVSAAGNNGNDKTWIHKERGRTSAGSFLRSYQRTAMITMKSANDFALRLVAYGDTANDTLLVNATTVLQQPDSVLSTRLYAINDSLEVLIEAYPSCYVPEETCYDLTLMSTSKTSVGASPRISFEVMGEEADVEVYRVQGNLVVNQLNPALCDGENTHTVLSPATSPNVICVGATCYRPGVINYLGNWRSWNNSDTNIYGERQVNSAMGPTMDGRIKPDVMAPGIYIISSYSSFFLENHPDASDITWDVAHFDFNDRTYAWNASSGTSMASPAVAGAIALWLQAKPDLTTEQVLDVFKHTCRHYDETLTYPNNYYGYGEIDVYRGLLYLLGADGIEGVSIAHTKARVGMSDGRLTVAFDNPVTEPVRVRLFSLSGRQMLSATLSAGLSNHAISLPRLPEAVYVVQIDGSADVCGSTLVRP